MTRGRGGVRIPPKIDDVIYEQPLMMTMKLRIVLMVYPMVRRRREPHCLQLRICENRTWWIGVKGSSRIKNGNKS